MYGYDKHPYGIDNVFLQAIDMVQRAPMGHEAFATAKAGEYLQTALLDGQRVVTNMLNGKDIEGMTFSPELMPPQETVLSRRVLQLFAERLKQAASFSALGYAPPEPKGTKAPAKIGSGRDDKPPKRPKLDGAPPPAGKLQMPANRKQFELLDEGEGYMTRYIFSADRGASAVRFDLKAIAASERVGVDERNWGWALCLSNPDRFAENGGKDHKRRHTPLSKEKKLEYSRPPYVTRVPIDE